jgi:hypothetical protein
MNQFRVSESFIVEIFFTSLLSKVHEDSFNKKLLANWVRYGTQSNAFSFFYNFECKKQIYEADTKCTRAMFDVLTIVLH